MIPGSTGFSPTQRALPPQISRPCRCRRHGSRRCTRWQRPAKSDPKLLDPVGTFDEALERLLALPGFGPWTAQYWALRALRDSDAFPAADVALLRHPAVSDNGSRPTPKALLARAEAWRPWRAYAAQHLWTSDAEAANG
ncbi:MAG: hypothetical protein WDM89_15630 [Rhizomicrobium sp.]